MNNTRRSHTVSGGVFTVRDDNAGIYRDDTNDYTRCGSCAGILEKNPERFLDS